MMAARTHDEGMDSDYHMRIRLTQPRALRPAALQWMISLLIPARLSQAEPYLSVRMKTPIHAGARGVSRCRRT